MEQKVLAASDERTRAIRLFVLAMTEAALQPSPLSGTQDPAFRHTHNSVWAGVKLEPVSEG